jgi:hypothetical protein
MANETRRARSGSAVNAGAAEKQPHFARSFFTPERAGERDEPATCSRSWATDCITYSSAPIKQASDFYA